MLNQFIQSYRDHVYKYTTMVRHKGAIIALAMDSERRIFYAVLDLQNKEVQNPLDVHYWPGAPLEVRFPNEISEVGIGVVGQTLLPVVQKGNRTPVARDRQVPETEKDHFLSTTARLTADAPFQVLSDGRHLFIFRQAIAASHADQVFKLDENDERIKDNNGNDVPLVDSTLLVDRFVLSGTTLQTKMEVRYQRSRNKTRPQSRKDSLGAKDLDEKPFYEPTQELRFVRGLQEGRFTVLLLPTGVAGVQRWQIFAHNRHSGQIDSYNVERAADGLFNTRGSQEPNFTGYAESALAFGSGDWHIALDKGVNVGGTFTQEAWIYPTGTAGSIEEMQALITDTGAAKGAAPSLWLYQGRAIRAGFGDDQHWYEFVTNQILTLNTWQHLAITFDGAAYHVYVDGEEKHRASQVDVYTDGVKQPQREALHGKKPSPNSAIHYFGAPPSSTAGGQALQGTLDEIRLWRRARGKAELQADMHQRLTGLEPGLAGYWRFDEASGDRVYDQTESATVGRRQGGRWVTSTAPVGENAGLSRSSFAIADRTFAAGPTALLYYPQETAIGQRGTLTPALKRSARVMLAVATQAIGGSKGEIAVLDWGVAKTGRLAQIPDQLLLPVINTAAPGSQSVDELLDLISSLERQTQSLRAEIGKLAIEIGAINTVIAILNAAIANQTVSAITTPSFTDLNVKVQALQDARTDLAAKQKYEQDLLRAPRTVMVTLYEHSWYRGRSLPLGLGLVGYTTLNQYGFNDLISSISIPEQLQVTVFEDAGFGGDKTTFTASVLNVGDEWKDRISSMDIAVNADYAQKQAAATRARQQAEQDVAEKENELRRELARLAIQKQGKEHEKQAKEILLTTKQTELQRLRTQLQEGGTAPMALIYTDPAGLSITGGLLGFAWSQETPQLYESATGKLALYFRGADDQFFVAYYNTLTQRAQYRLLDEHGQACVLGRARSTEAEMDQIKISLTDAGDDAACTVTIIGPEMAGQAPIVETWQKVPLAPERFVKVLNGQASERAFVGMGEIVVNQGRVEEVKIAAGVRRALTAGTTLVVDQIRLQVRTQVDKGATTIAVDGQLTNPPAEPLPVFFLEYDYATLAQTTRVPADLSNGSLLIVADALSSNPVQSEQTTTSGATLIGHWSAATPGYTLAFDGAQTYAQADAATLKKFAAPADVTLEAWVRPQNMVGRGQIIQQQSQAASYQLGLERMDLLSALRLEGNSDRVSVAAHAALNFGGVITLEAWIKPSLTDGLRSIISHDFDPASGRELYLRIQDGHYAVGVQAGGTHHRTQFAVPEADKSGREWVHLAGVYDGAAWRLYRNGVEVNVTSASVGALALNTAWSIGGSGGGVDDRLFKGEIDDVRIWKRARTPGEILADKDRRLGGNETDLVAYWHFEDGAARDYARHGLHGSVQGAPTLTVSPLPGYQAYAGVGEKVVQTEATFAGGSWSHLAAVYNQSYALHFDGSQSAYLDCGNDATLDLSGDLTIEVFLQVQTDQPCGILARGKIDDGTNQDTPYALYIQKGKLVFAFEDTAHANHTFASSDNAIRQEHFTRIAVTRELQVKTESGKDDKGMVTGAKVQRWYDIKLYNATGEVGSFQYWTQDGDKDLSEYPYSGKEPGSSNGALEIGRAFLEKFREARFKGVISEVRIWSIARGAGSIGGAIKGNEKGLVAWWRCEENTGNVAFDAKGANHAKFQGQITWIKNPDFTASTFAFYRDGVSLATSSRPATDFAGADAQFTLGASVQGGAPRHHFQGELEEVRVWQVARTQEQLQDNLFGRLQGEKEGLIAYYTFDAQQTAARLADYGLRGNALTVQAPNYVFSTAPIGEDTPQVRNAVAAVRTPFHGLLQSRPAVQEYGDLQYDVDGNLIGVLKRCYALIGQEGQWQLITGFKIGNLVTEWIGQVQTAPQLLGYIEGAPPAPSENFTGTGYVLGEFSDYQGATAVELTEAQKTTYTYAAEKENGFDMSVEGKLGFILGQKVSAGIGLLKEAVKVENVVGFHFQFENSESWLSSARTGAGITTAKVSGMALRGSVENVDAIAYPYPKIGRRYVPDNVGFALVQSNTADVFALRLHHTRALVSYQMQPNPDIPPDWNILTFPINRHYTKQGVLDGKVALDTDPDYPNAFDYSPDISYFKPLEAYALKNRIQREEETIRTYYQQYEAGKIGRRDESYLTSYEDLADGDLPNKLPKVEKRNLVNTYVWTADGGLFADTEETMDLRQESLGGSYAFKWLAGAYMDLTFALFGRGVKLELDALFGGHLNLTVNKSQESETSFGLNVTLDKVEGDIYWRTEAGELIMDTSDPRNPTPKKWPGKVDAYRFMSFYLEPKVDHFDHFFAKVIDPIWLEQSDAPNAAALRQARQIDQKPACWRLMHRVTFVSRILPELNDPTAPPLERTLKALDIDSNYELIKLLEPFVINHLTNYADFANAIRATIKLYHPELQPHSAAIIQYMSLYYGITEDTLGQLDGALVEDDFSNDGAPMLPVVDAGPSTQEIGVGSKLELEGALRNSQQPLENLFIAWRQRSGPDVASFSDAHALTTTATFNERGLYHLQLTVADGLLTISDDMEVIVNSPPTVDAGNDQELLRRQPAQLTGALLNNGLGDPKRGHVTVNWSVVNGPGAVHFVDASALRTTATFSESGAYLLRLTADNGSFETSDEITINVAGRVIRDLQTLYVFKEGAGLQIRDVAAVSPPLPLMIPATAQVHWNEGLVIQEPVTLATETSLERLVKALRSTNELTIEAWIKPSVATQNGLARIITLSKGPSERNFILGQRGSHYYAGIRTNTTDKYASDKALAAGTVDPDALTHLVCTRTASGQLQLYINGDVVGQRLVDGTFSTWGHGGVQLALGNEVGQNGGVDRAWSGEFHLVALYSRALSPAEIKQNFDFGANTNLSPTVMAGPDQMINLLTTQLQGAVLDDRLLSEQITDIQWTQASGPTSVAFADPTALHTAVTFVAKGRYVLRLTASDGKLAASDEVSIIVNTAPQINAGEVQWLIHSAAAPATTGLQGVITNSGVGDEALPGNVTSIWSKEDGPGDVSFTDARALDSTVTFRAPGKYVLRLTVDNGYLPPTAATTTIFVNQAPVIQASASPLITLPASAVLTGREVESGLADPQGQVMRTWTKVSGPGEVTFAATDALSTTASFSQSGVYVLKLTVTISGEKLYGQKYSQASEAEVRIVVNQAPVVYAGPDQQITLPAQAELEGTVSDDGLPEDPGKVTTRWSKVSGPADVDFANDKDVYTTARFRKPGTYVLRLTAKDYEQATPVYDEVTIEVLKAPR
ncbi:MAG: LamG-like jellyroll fold domain-containing protein [Caldilineaceae bacterium]